MAYCAAIDVVPCQHQRPGSLVDVVMDVSGEQASSRLEAAVLIGDTESLHERAEDSITRLARATALTDADISSGIQTGPQLEGLS